MAWAAMDHDSGAAENTVQTPYGERMPFVYFELMTMEAHLIEARSYPHLWSSPFLNTMLLKVGQITYDLANRPLLLGSHL